MSTYFEDEAGYQLKQYLGTGERLQWSGRPKSGLLLRKSDAFLIPFSLFWCGFVVFWEFMAYTMGAPVFFMIFGVPFVLIGIYLLIGRFFIDAAIRKKMLYGVTEKRIIIRQGLFSPEIKSYDIKSIANLNFTEKPDGSGSITLGPEDSSRYSSGRTYRSSTLSPKLDLIDDVRKVYDLIVRFHKASV